MDPFVPDRKAMIQGNEVPSCLVQMHPGGAFPVTTLSCGAEERAPQICCKKGRMVFISDVIQAIFPANDLNVLVGTTFPPYIVQANSSVSAMRSGLMLTLIPSLVVENFPTIQTTLCPLCPFRKDSGKPNALQATTSSAMSLSRCALSPLMHATGSST